MRSIMQNSNSLLADRKAISALEYGLIAAGFGLVMVGEFHYLSGVFQQIYLKIGVMNPPN